MMTLVFLLIFSAILSGFIFQSSFDAESTKTGFAPVKVIAFTVAIIVKVGKITSSPGPTLKAFKAKKRPDVPLLTEVAYFVLATCLAKEFSNFSTHGLFEDIQDESKHFLISKKSCRVRLGFDIGILNID